MSEDSYVTELSQETQPGASMLRRFGAFFYLSGIGFLLRRLRLSDRSVEYIKEASQEKRVVYVLYTRSKMDWLALNKVLNEHELPLAQFSMGMRSFLFRPILKLIQEGWQALTGFFGSKTPEEAVLKKSLIHGGIVAVSLVRSTATGTKTTGAIKHLFSLQKILNEQNKDENIVLLPVAVVWNRRPAKLRSETMRFLLGAEDEPGPLQKLFFVASRDHQPIVQIGEPLSLKQAFEHYENVSEDRKIRAVRLLLRRYLFRESHVIRGPRIRSYSWVKRLVLESADVRALIKKEKERTGRSEESLRREVSKNLDTIAARFSFRAVSIVAFCCNLIWSRIYSGVDIREVDVERFQTALREGTPILIPSHRSHLDYLLISSQFHAMGLALPYVVAGDNLLFFPFGVIMRRCGAFFIKRSFKNEPIFPVVFARYVKQLIRDEFPVEFFIEGGRSRTGKLLPPKIGMLGIVADAAADNRPDRKVSILPISISYEQIAEEKSYAHELAGGKKKRESFGTILKARSVLKKRFGKVYLRVGEPIFLNQEIETFCSDWKEVDPEDKREFLSEIGEQVMYEIGQNMLILPTGITAMAILADSTMGVRRTIVLERAERFDRLLRLQGAMSAASLDHGGWVVKEALERFLSEKWIDVISDEDGEIVQIFPEARLTMEYYKNGLLHFVAPLSFLSNAILSVVSKLKGAAREKTDAEQSVLIAEIKRLFVLQVYMMRYEFPSNPALSAEELLLEALKMLVVYGAIEGVDEEQKNLWSKQFESKNIESTNTEKDPSPPSISMLLNVHNKLYLEELGGLTRNFLESYRLTLKGAYSLRQYSIQEKQLTLKIQEFGKARMAVQEFRWPESLSKVNIANALRAFREEGVLNVRADGQGIGFDESVYKQYISDLKRLCFPEL